MMGAKEELTKILKTGDADDNFPFEQMSDSTSEDQWKRHKHLDDKELANYNYDKVGGRFGNNLLDALAPMLSSAPIRGMDYEKVNELRRAMDRILNEYIKEMPNRNHPNHQKVADMANYSGQNKWVLYKPVNKSAFVKSELSKVLKEWK